MPPGTPPPFEPRHGPYARGARGSLHARAIVPALIITLALVAAVLVVIFWAPGGAAGTPTQVYMDSGNGRLVVTVSSLEIGKVETREEGGATTEATTWARMSPAEGARDTRDGPVLLGEGDAHGDGYTEARIVFEEVRYARDGTLHALAIPQDTLQIRMTDPGAAGDALLIVLDAEKSVTDEGGFLTFRPRVLDTLWEPDGAATNTPPAYTPRSTDPDGPGDPFQTGPTTVTSDSKGTKDTEQPPAVGRLHIAFVGNGTGLVEQLNVTVSKIGLGKDGNDVVTVHENDARTDVARPRDEGVAELASMQLAPGTYTSIHFEFTHADATISRAEHELVIPQPLLVLEAPFNIIAGEAVALAVEFGVEDSIRVGLEGLEFRPVIWNYHLHGSDGRDLKDPYPAQYRTGGSWLPALGDTGDALSEIGIDPNDEPHPVHGDRDRDPRSEGSLSDLDPDDLEELLNGLGNNLGDLG